MREAKPCARCSGGAKPPGNGRGVDVKQNRGEGRDVAAAAFSQVAWTGVRNGGSLGRRAWLLVASALADGTLRGLALATGLAATVPMLAPSEAAAQFL